MSAPKGAKDKDVVIEKTGSAPHQSPTHEGATARSVPSVTFPPNADER